MTAHMFAQCTEPICSAVPLAGGGWEVPGGSAGSWQPPVVALRGTTMQAALLQAYSTQKNIPIMQADFQSVCTLSVPASGHAEAKLLFLRTVLRNQLKTHL
jgi:hypothetical protein